MWLESIGKRSNYNHSPVKIRLTFSEILVFMMKLSSVLTFGRAYIQKCVGSLFIDQF